MYQVRLRLSSGEFDLNFADQASYRRWEYVVEFPLVILSQKEVQEVDRKEGELEEGVNEYLGD